MSDDLFNRLEPFTEPTKNVIERHPERVSEDDQGRKRFDHRTHKSIIVTVSPTSLQYGFLMGAFTHGQSRILNLGDKLQDIMLTPEKKHATEAESACSEIAVAKFLDIRWDALVQKYKTGGDVGNWVQVRHQMRMIRGLHIRKPDPKNKPYVAISGCLGTYLIHGWEFGFEAIKRDPSYADTSSPAWVVPFGKLKPMEDFPGDAPWKVDDHPTDQEFKEIMKALKP